MPNKKFYPPLERICPQCKSIIYYSYNKDYKRATAIDQSCLKCVRLNKSKVLEANRPVYERKCNDCGKILIYSCKDNMDRANKANTPCHECAGNKYKGSGTILATRKCPSCKNTIEYKSLQGYLKAVKLESVCQRCDDDKRDIHKGVYTLPCPQCKKDRIYTYYEGYISAKTSNRPCHTCAVNDREYRRGLRENMVRQIEEKRNNGHPIYPGYNPKACDFFELLNKELKLAGYHAMNGGEYKIGELTYWIDYYEPNLNLVIEWNERYHKYGDKPEKDERRRQEIIEHLGCKFHIIWQSNFDPDIEIERIKLLIR